METKICLSKEGKELLGTNHPVWTNGLFGDMTETKTKLLNKLAAEGYSTGWAQSVARFPTQVGEVICRLAIEKGLSDKAIAEGTGLKAAHVAASMTIARALGLIPAGTVNNVMALQRVKSMELRAARRAARKEARDNPQKILTSLHVDKGIRHGVRPKQADALARAAALLNGVVAPAIPVVAPAIPVVPTHAATQATKLQQSKPVQLTPVIVESPGIETDPTKRVVEVTLRMTVGELDDFVSSVNGRKTANVPGEIS